MKALEIHTFGAPPAGEHYFIMSTQHAAALGDLSQAAVPVRLDMWCPPWADDEHEVALVYEVWQV